MRSLRGLPLVLVSLILIGSALSSPAIADWNEGDPYKMHYPQLPDPFGWDVRVSNGPMNTFTVADDWLCTESGPVSAVHFWYSWKGDQISNIASVHLSIHADVPKGPNGEYSRPGDLLWSQNFGPNEFSSRFYGAGSQGWYNPVQPLVIPNDHQAFYQLNITDIANPFAQVKDTVYWLDISVDVLYDPTRDRQNLGWKTSLNHWNDDAVYRDANGEWKELIDPNTGQSLDMAFVVVPEPSSCLLLGFGFLGMALVARRARRKAY